MASFVTRANPIKWLFNQARRVYNRVRGERTDRSVRPTDTVRDRYINQSLDGVGELAAQLASGDMRTGQWVLGMREQIRRSYISEYLLAKGGRENMTQEDWGRLGGLLQNQYRYLNRFAQDINAGTMSEAQIAQRSQLYIKSARQAYERGQVAGLGMPALPAYPGDGSTVCLTNCQCHWEITQAEEEWLAYWTLGAAEHCPDCMERAQNWAPYRLPRVPV